MIRLIPIIITLLTIGFAQDITNKLGASGNYDITDSIDNLLFQVQEDGLVEIYGDVELRGEIYDGSANTGLNGQILSATGTSTKWIDQTSINSILIYTTTPQSLSGGERVMTTVDKPSDGGDLGDLGEESDPIVFYLPSASGNSGQSIEIFIARADGDPMINFSQAVTSVYNNTAYSANSNFKVSSQHEAKITLVSDGSIWWGFGIESAEIVISQP